MRVESNHRSEAQNLVYLPLYDTSITLTQELKLIISRKLVGNLLLTVGRKEVWKTSSIYDLLLYRCGRRTRTSDLQVMSLKSYRCSIPLYLSGRRGSNPQPRPWQGRALPIAPLPHMKDE